MLSKTTLVLSGNNIICGCQHGRLSISNFSGNHSSSFVRALSYSRRVKNSCDGSQPQLQQKGWRILGRYFSSHHNNDPAGTSVRPEEIEKFERMSSSWWDQSEGQMKELHSMNRLRVPFIRDGLLQKAGRKAADIPKPLEGFNILDVGCGGGVLCEPLGRLGATVKGIDPGKGNITIATNHLSEELRDKVSYECVSIEDFAMNFQENGYDGIVMSEVIEHVEKPEEFIRIGSSLLKPGGSLFLTTLNRTVESWMGAIVAWEYLLRRLPVGTHEWKRFLTPEEISRMFKSNGLRTVLVHGMCYNPVNNTWKWSTQRGINYAIHAVKDA